MTTVLQALDALAHAEGWLGKVALGAWAVACLVACVALATKRASVLWAAVTTLAIAWLAMLAPIAVICDRMIHADPSEVRWGQFGLSLGYLHAGGAALTIATLLTAAAAARRQGPTAMLPWLPLGVAAVGAALFPRSFFQPYASIGTAISITEMIELSGAVVQHVREAVVGVGIGAVVLVGWRESRAPHPAEALGWLLVGTGAFLATRGHAHDATHPLPPHERALDDLSVPHPEGATCQRPQRFFGTRHHTVRFEGGLRIDREAVTDLQARVFDMRVEHLRDHPGEQFDVVLRFLDRPSAEDAPTLRALANAGFPAPELLTIRRFDVHTATAGTITLEESCAAPWAPWPPE